VATVQAGGRNRRLGRAAAGQYQVTVVATTGGVERSQVLTFVYLPDDKARTVTAKRLRLTK